MKMIRVITFFILLIALTWTGCSPTKHLPPNDKLYTGARVTVKGASSVRERKTLRSDLIGLTRPRANTKFLGMPIKLSIYNMFYTKKPKSLFGKLRDRFGEPPVLLSELDLEHNEKVLESHLQNKGYFKASVNGDTTIRRKKASAHYTAEVGIQYKINTVHFPTDSSELSLAISHTTAKTLLKAGDPFDLDVIKGERTRIDASLKENGFYFFSPDYILVKTDSTIGDNKVDLYLTIKPETPRAATRIYRINDVFIYSGYSLNTAAVDTLKSMAKYYKGYYIIDREERYKPYLFEETMQFNRGDIYNRTEHNRTLNRLINLNLFKFVKNRFEVVPVDSAQLDAFYYLTPLPRKSINAVVTAINRSNNLNGSQLNLSFTDRNLFRSGAQGNITAYVGSDVQFAGAYKGYNTYRTGVEANYVIPRFVVPFMNLRRRGPYAPRTTIKAGYDILNRKNLFTLNSYRLEYGYSWKKDLQRSHEFFPVSISYIRPLNITSEFNDKFRYNFPGVERTIEQQFILGSRYEYLYNQLANNLQPLNAYYFNGIVDLSGNIAGLATGANAKKGDTVMIYNAPFAQYVKFETDFRYYRKIGLKSTWANRIDIGVGYPYGNSIEVPYIKQFFVGGNNSLRGFRSRSVGPGTYTPTTNVTTVIPDQTGDIKLEMNTEFRPHISGPLYGAIFIDAGNIWLVNDSNYTKKPGAQFTGKFLNQLAVDAGVGLRLDITVFVIRLDVAFPVRKPWTIPPWVLRDINFKDQPWRRQNIVYNLAIGYPF